jgi:hypothetical protein
MIIDKQMELSNAQAVTATAASSNQLDLGPNGPWGSSGSDEPLEMFLNVDTTFTAAGAATLTIQLRSSPNANMSSPTVHLQSDAIPVASLVAGSRVPFWPRLPQNVGRYVDVNYVVATGPFTAGNISCRGTMDRQLNR